MSRFFRLARMASVPALALMVVAVPSHAQKAAALKWGPAPAVFPHGAKMAVVSGDPVQLAWLLGAMLLAVGGGHHVDPETLRCREKCLVAIACGGQQQQDAWHGQNACSC